MAAALQSRHWDPSIPTSSITSSGPASSRSFPYDSKSDITSLDQFTPSAARNSHSIEDGDMTSQQWASLASNLAIQPADTPRSSPEAQKFARKIGKQRKLSDKQTSELLLPVLTSITADHPRLLPVLSTTFHRDAVPLDHPSFIFNKTRLPTPRPAFTIGYNPQIFHPHYRELMQGIISDPAGQPRNLDKISMTCPATYWPFFVIEINDDSYSPSYAAASAAAATATCNNAVLTLASVLNDVSNPIQHDPSFREMLTKSVSSFSLALSAQIKSASLFAHTTTFEEPYFHATDAVEPVKTYNLSNPADVESLASRLNSIFTWAESTRLLSIMDILDKFDARVQFRETKVAQETDMFGPMDVMQRGQAAPKLMPGMVQMSGGMGKGITIPKGLVSQKPASAPLPLTSKSLFAGKSGHAKSESKAGLLSKALDVGDGTKESSVRTDSGSTNGHGKSKESLSRKAAPVLVGDGKREGSLLPNTSGGTSGYGHSDVGTQVHHQTQTQKPKQKQSQKHPRIGERVGERLVERAPEIPKETPFGERGRPPTTHLRVSPNTPPTPESMKLTLNTVAVDGGTGVSGKKKSLLKTVINDAMPAWTRVEI